MALFSIAMRSVFLWLVILSLLTPNAVAVVTGKVVVVHVGDSLTLLTSENVQIKVRHEGIDASELKQPFGEALKKALSDLVFGKIVRLEERLLQAKAREHLHRRDLGQPLDGREGNGVVLPSRQPRKVAGSSGNNGSRG